MYARLQRTFLARGAADAWRAVRGGAASPRRTRAGGCGAHSTRARRVHGDAAARPRRRCDPPSESRCRDRRRRRRAGGCGVTPVSAHRSYPRSKGVGTASIFLHRCSSRTLRNLAASIAFHRASSVVAVLDPSTHNRHLCGIPTILPAQSSPWQRPCPPCLHATQAVHDSLAMQSRPGPGTPADRRPLVSGRRPRCSRPGPGLLLPSDCRLPVMSWKEFSSRSWARTRSSAQTRSSAGAGGARNAPQRTVARDADAASRGPARRWPAGGGAATRPGLGDSDGPGDLDGNRRLGVVAGSGEAAAVGARVLHTHLPAGYEDA